MALAAVGAVQALLPSVDSYLNAQSGRAAQRYTTGELFTAVNRMAGLRRLEDPGFHDRLNVAQQVGSNGPGQILSSCVAVGQAGLTMAGFLVTLALISPFIAAVVLLAAIPGLVTELGLSRRRVALIYGFSHAQRRQFFYASLLVDYAAAKEIRLFGLGNFFRLRLLGELRSIQRASERLDRRQLAVYTGLAALGAFIAAGGLLWAAFAAARGRLSVGDVSIFVAALGAVSTSLGTMIANGAGAYQALLMFRTYRDVVAGEPDLAQPPQPAAVPALRSSILAVIPASVPELQKRTRSIDATRSQMSAASSTCAAERAGHALPSRTALLTALTIGGYALP